MTTKLLPIAVALGILPAALQATPIPLAPGIQQSITDKELWTQQMVLAHVKETLNDPGPGSDIPTRDNSAKVNNLAFQSHKVEKLEDFAGELDLTGIEESVRISILVDDKATLNVTSAGGFSANYAVNGSALWREQSFEMFSTILPGKTKYQLKLTYQNTANLTNQPAYAGKVDVDGVNIYVSSVETDVWIKDSRSHVAKCVVGSLPAGGNLEVSMSYTLTWEGRVKGGASEYRNLHWVITNGKRKIPLPNGAILDYQPQAVDPASGALVNNGPRIRGLVPPGWSLTIFDIGSTINTAGDKMEIGGTNINFGNHAAPPPNTVCGANPQFAQINVQGGSLTFQDSGHGFIFGFEDPTGAGGALTPFAIGTPFSLANPPINP